MTEAKEVKEAIPFSPYGREAGVVRTLAQLPESYLLYMGPVACARHDYLSGMYAFTDRISYLCPHELDVIFGKTEVLVAEAVAEILGRIAPNAKAIILYTGCQNSLSPVDFDALVRKLQETHGILVSYYNMNHFLRAGKGNVYPPLYQSLLQTLDYMSAAQEEGGNAVNILSPALSLHTGNDLPQLLANWGAGNLQGIGNSGTLEEFKGMAAARLNIVTHPDFLPAAKDMESKWGIPWLYLPASYRLEDIDRQYKELAGWFGKEAEAGEARREAEEKIANVRSLLNDTPVRLDGDCFLKPLSAARFFLEEGFQVSGIDRLPDLKQYRRLDPEGLEWLREHAPHLLESEPATSPGKLWELHCMSSDAAKPVEGAWFGYSAVVQLMEQLEQAWMKSGSADPTNREGGITG